MNEQKKKKIRMKVLYKQKGFQILFPLLLGEYNKETSNEIKNNYVTAIANLSKDVPKGALKPVMSSVMCQSN